ncbi:MULTISPECIES: PE family protein [unclassified Mycobacterium]|uniref:PE family protein n=1 Tax=unclassified Mycobacterium TaxID=2642494 RepID=UPI000F9014F3|nr:MULTISPECIES: PE family protein [unclassified Mycobacterium]MDP7707226.1 PE family protein [Mycobacterium sp. TY815]MDP7723827.1 PE family protein [Mycobacterium sp. TY814]RUP05767.1 MAG: PE family protein [Mycobacterium sp.]
MSWFVAGPEAMAAAAGNLARIGSTIGESNATAAEQTAGVPASAADQVSAAIATFWDAHARGYVDISNQMAAFHDQFVQALTAGGNAYANAEAAAASSMQGVRDLLGPSA